MSSDYDSTDVKFWLREIETKGSDAVSSMLVSKLGTPEAKAIQMAMVEYHKGQDANKANTRKSPAAEQTPLAAESTNDDRKTFLIACTALGVASVALLLSVVNFFIRS